MKSQPRAQSDACSLNDLMAWHQWALISSPDPSSQHVHTHWIQCGSNDVLAGKWQTFSECFLLAKLYAQTPGQAWWPPSVHPYLFHYFDGFHPVLGWGVEQHAVIEGLEHGLHGVHRPHQPDQLGCNVIDGPSHGPARGRCAGGTA